SFLVKDTSGADVGERKVRVRGRVCRAIEEPAALVLATMISVVRPRAETTVALPPALPPADGPPPGPGSQVPTSAVPMGDARPPASSAAKAAGLGEPSHPRITLGAAGVASVGVVPQAGLGVALRTTYAPHARLLFGLETSFERGAHIRTGRGEVGFEVLSASISAGLQVLRPGQFEIVPLVAVRGGVLRTVPSGFQLVKRQAHPLALAGVGALLRAWLAPHFYAEALPQAEVVLIRDVFEATEGRTIYFLHQPSAVGARLSVGVGYEFP
ncbi:MAG: hypothetical protein K0S65_6096, partial [Labilithrix sp.]|nr:hypothetical protein [Labilithrix sp.]